MPIRRIRSDCPYSTTQQLVIGDLFREVVEEQNPALSELAKRVAKAAGFDEGGAEPGIEREDYAAIFDDAKSKGLGLALADFQAKLVDVQQRARIHAGISVVNCINGTRTVRTGDSFAEVVQRFQEARLPVEQVQLLVNHAVTWPSLTTHPTNPTSLEYTRAGLALNACLADPATTRAKLLDALRMVRDAPLDVPLTDGRKAAKKTTSEEVDELVAIMSVLYQSVTAPYLRLRAALDKCGYGRVLLNHTLLDLNVWGAGDGDGNPNQTGTTLMAQILTFRNAIATLYAADLRAIAGSASTSLAAQAKNPFSEIVSDLERGEYADAAALISDLDNVRCTAQCDDAIAALKIRMRTFGLHFARTDLRHNSEDIMTAISVLLHFGTLDCTDTKERPPSGRRASKRFVAASLFFQMSAEEQAVELSARLNDTEFCKRVQKLSESCKELEGIAASEDVEVATRLFQRVRVVAKYPDAFQKFIIAENRSAANVLAALLLLQLGGSVVAAVGATTNIVPLFESREDLVNAPATIQTLVADPIFLRHLQHVGYLLLMVAKSDTTRLSGPGVQGVQEYMYGQVLAMEPRSYKNVPTYVMLGGGDDQMRGGGRIVEAPHVVMKAANRMGSHNNVKVAMTIQGMQLQLVFGSTLLAEHFIEAFAAQSLLAGARICDYIPWRSHPAIVNLPAALRQVEFFFEKAMDNYQALVGSEQPGDRRRQTLIDYFSGFPAIIVTQANKSSRPGARLKTMDPLRGRAISLDQHSKHDGAYVTATLGVASALKQFNSMLRCGAPEKEGYPPLSPLRHAYLCNKSFRDFVRLQATVLFQKDYATAWMLRGGEPPHAEKVALAASFVAKHEADETASPREFLAYLQLEDMLEAALLCLAIRGRDVGDSAPLEEPLRSGWPDLADHVTYRRQQSLFSRWLESRIAKQLGEQPDGGVAFPDAELAALGHRAYVGANVAFGTPSFSMTMTDPQKEGNLLMTESAVARKLALPAWAQ